MDQLKDYQDISKNMLAKNKERVFAIHTRSKTSRASDLQLQPSPMIDLETPAPIRVTSRGPVTASKPITLTAAKIKDEEDQFKFTNIAKKVVTARRLQHMRQASDHIRYEMDHPENIVKYLTGNRIFYENVTKRKVKAIMRKFPFTRNETYKNEKDIVELKTKKMLKVKLPREKTNLRGETAKYTEDYPFEFDRVFDELTANHVVYADCVQSEIEDVFRGNVKTIIAFYGTSGTGKTFSILGDPGDEIRRPNPGITLQAMKDVMDEADKRGERVLMSYYEIYNRKVFDLLDEKRVISIEETKDSSILVGITKAPLTTLEDFMDLVQQGRDCWQSNFMHPNAEGRKSFLVIEITFPEKKDAGGLVFLEMAADEPPTQEELWDKESRMVMNDLKLTFATFKECARSMEAPKRVPPFRASSLTMALKRYFIGNSFILFIGHFNPVLPQEQNIFRVMTYCSKIRKPPGEVLTLQVAKSSTLEVKRAKDEAVVAEKVDYVKMMNDPKERFIDNEDHNYLIELGSSPPDSRIQSLLDSARKTHRPLTAEAMFSTPVKPGLSATNSSFFPGVQLQMTKTKDTDTKEEPPMSDLKVTEKKSPKKKKKVESIKKTVEIRMNKTKQRLEGLLALAEQSQEPDESPRSPRRRDDWSPVRKMETLSTPNTKLVSSGGVFFSRTQVPTSANRIKGSEIEDNLELQEQIMHLNKRDELQERKHLSKEKDKHYRASQRKYLQREKYGHYITPHVSPQKAEKDLIRRKNEYFSSVAQVFNPELSARTSAHYRYVENKEMVNELCMQISGQCDQQKIKNKGVKRMLSEEIGSISSSLAQIKNKFYSPEQMIEINLKEEFMREYQLQSQQLPDSKR